MPTNGVDSAPAVVVTARHSGRQPQYDGPWRRIRLQVLQRDGHVCQVRLPGCTLIGTEADHIVPTSQGGAWFDTNNLRASCKHCNLARKGKVQDQGWRWAKTRVYLVVGPPGDGKTTYVAEHAAPSDLVIDYDQIALALGTGGQPSAHGPAMVARNALLKSLSRGTLGVGVVWLISANPKAESMFPHHRVHVVDPALPELEARELGSTRLELARSWYAARAKAGTVARQPSRAR